MNDGRMCCRYPCSAVHTHPLAPHNVEGLLRGEKWIDRELVWNMQFVIFGETNIKGLPNSDGLDA